MSFHDPTPDNPYDLVLLDATPAVSPMPAGSLGTITVHWEPPIDYAPGYGAELYCYAFAHIFGYTLDTPPTSTPPGGTGWILDAGAPGVDSPDPSVIPPGATEWTIGAIAGVDIWFWAAACFIVRDTDPISYPTLPCTDLVFGKIETEPIVIGAGVFVSARTA